MGSWVKLDTPAQKFRVLPPPPYHHPEVAVGLPGGEICLHSIIFCFLCEQTFLTAFHSRLWLRFSYETMWNHLFLYILHKKYIKIVSLF